jgi:uncharacterized protein (TIGR02453 family)
MIQPHTVKFLKDLKKNNNREWFEANRKKYEEAKADFEAFVANVLAELSNVDETIAHLKPKDCMFRINRDVRFSKNKAPYKTNFAMYISKGGKKTSDAGYYFHCEPGSAFIAGGVWMPMAPELKKIRQEIDYNFEEFQGILSETVFNNAFGNLDRSEGGVLTRPPKGYEDNNPAIEYLKLKSFIATAPLPDEALAHNALVNTVVEHFKTMKPFVDFLNHALS